ncbi:LysR family transcriptional regulator [Pigmentiphaga aceris]|uniref:LysR family transcriptional regulator n=1 Tax=Pigmentiphaga aceris TaxID=1940612 RepID=A0A5C0AXV6_9BURK|nr:LysR family transcriptional regulator [Pigmentiphaga aceris]QEI07322.1 LysR family transcriptional regulator [Pigmentiphaga aceris]
MDIRRSDLPLLISLDVLLEERNVTKAAKRLHISQPALSAQLSRLRDLFDDPLLVPSEAGRGMVPTAKALALQTGLHDALMDLQSAVQSQEKFDPTRQSRHFVVAIDDNVFTIIGMAVAKMVLAQYSPNIRLSFVTPEETNLVYSMERREIDLYLGLRDKIPGPLRSRHLLTDTFRVAQRRGHPRGPGPLSLAEYCRLAHVMVSRQGMLHSSIDDALAALDARRDVHITVSSYNQVPLVLADTDCITTLPNLLLQRYADGLDIFEPPLRLPSFDIAMAWHPRAHDDLGHQWLRDRFVAAAGALTDVS